MSYTPTDPARPWIVDENGYRRCHYCAGTGSTYYLDRNDEVRASRGSCSPCHGTGKRYVPKRDRPVSMLQ